MLIIVEGPDCAGKTTIVEQLVEMIGRSHPNDKITQLHVGPLKQHPLDEYVMPLVDYRPGNGEHVICDRWHWGERIYPEVLGRASVMDRGIWLYIEMFLRSRGAVVLYPYVATPTLRERMKARGDSLITLDMIPKIAHGYQAISFLSNLHVLRLTTQWMSKSEMLDAETLRQFIDEAGRAQAATQPLGGLTTYIGPPRPDYVLYGDVRNRSPLGDQRPAFMPYPATSGHFLMNALANVHHHRIATLGILNACDVDEPVFADEVLYRPKPVTLGRKAHACAPTNAHSQVPHPQFIRRFYHDKQDAYGKLINDGLAVIGDYSKWRG